MPPPLPPTEPAAPPSPPVPGGLEDVLAEIRRIATQELGMDRPILPSDELVRDLGLDSIELTILAVELENHFRLKLQEEDAYVLTVEDLGRQVLRRAAEAREAGP